MSRLARFAKLKCFGAIRSGAMLAMGFTTAIVIGGVSLKFPGLEPISEIHFTGQLEKLSEKQLRDSIQSVPRKNYFLIDLQAMETLLEAMTWVDKVTLTRLWPDRLHIDVVEKRAIARWAEGGLLNQDGRLFYPEQSDYPQNLPMASSTTVSPQEVADRLIQFSQILAKADLTIKTLQISDRGVWKLILKHDLALILGRQHLVQRVDRFVAVLPRLGNDRQITRVDLRYANGMAVQMKRVQAGTKASG